MASPIGEGSKAGNKTYRGENQNDSEVRTKAPYYRLIFDEPNRLISNSDEPIRPFDSLEKCSCKMS